MSVFSPDIINKDIDYRPDPHENMCFQITRQFNKLCDLYEPCCPDDFLTFIKDAMGVFMSELGRNTWRTETVLPEWWRGDFLHIKSWNVINIRLTDGRVGVQCAWTYSNTYEWKDISLLVDTTGLTQKYKNWVL